MIWIAQLSCRLPRGFNRCRTFGPDEASIGAGAWQLAKQRRVENRSMFPVPPMTIAAVWDGPSPV